MPEHTFTSENFDAAVLGADKPVFVDFWAPWCGPCKVMSPIVEELAGEMEEVLIGKVNVDEHSEIAQKYNILSIPTFIIFKSGQVAEQFSGSMSKEALRAKIEKYVS
ncbi:MAG: thioredoxin [Patescibacteria group bacterium]